MKPGAGAAIASLPSEMMNEVLLAADHFQDIKLHAIGLDDSNLKYIRETYGDRLIGNEFYTHRKAALNLE